MSVQCIKSNTCKDKHCGHSKPHEEKEIGVFASDKYCTVLSPCSESSEPVRCLLIM